MTRYEYCMEMSGKCRRAAAALYAVSDRLGGEIFDHAENGFFEKAQKMPAAQAAEKSNLDDRLEDFESWVTEKEESAAWMQKNGLNRER